MSGAYSKKWPHVSTLELSCKLCGKVHGKPLPELLDLYEATRKNCGGYPLLINDACRCQERQDMLVRRGDHAAKTKPPHVPFEYPDGVSYFHALDVQSLHVPAWKIAREVEKLMPKAGIGIKIYGGRFVHFDVCHLCPGGRWRAGRRW